MNENMIQVGKCVVLNADVAAMFGRDANVIYRVVDCRGVGSDPTWKIAVNLENGVDAASALDVFKGDVRVVGE